MQCLFFLKKLSTKSIALGSHISQLSHFVMLSGTEPISRNCITHLSACSSHRCPIRVSFWITLYTVSSAQCYTMYFSVYCIIHCYSTFTLHYTLFCTLYCILYFTLNSYLHCIVLKITNEQYQIEQNEYDKYPVIECENHQRLKSRL